MKLTDVEIKAVKESIQHWKDDVKAHLLTGDKIVKNGYFLAWKKQNKQVECYSKHCALCKLAVDCFECPYYKNYSCYCTKLEWKDFITNPCLKTCNKMIKALKGI